MSFWAWVIAALIFVSVFAFFNIRADMRESELCTKAGGTWYTRPRGCAVPMKKPPEGGLLGTEAIKP